MDPNSLGLMFSWKLSTLSDQAEMAESLRRVNRMEFKRAVGVHSSTMSAEDFRKSVDACWNWLDGSKLIWTNMSLSDQKTESQTVVSKCRRKCKHFFAFNLLLLCYLSNLLLKLQLHIGHKNILELESPWTALPVLEILWNFIILFWKCYFKPLNFPLHLGSKLKHKGNNQKSENIQTVSMTYCS